MMKNALIHLAIFGALLTPPPGFAQQAKKPAAAPKAKAVEAAPATPPDGILGANWTVAPLKGNTFEAPKPDPVPAMLAAGRQLYVFSTDQAGPGARLRVVLRFRDLAGRANVNLAAGLKDPADLKERGHFVTVTGRVGTAAWSVADPNSKERLPMSTGIYRPQYLVERSLSWPESLRRNVEADMVNSPPLDQRWLALELRLLEKGYEVSLDGIPLKRVEAESINPRGFLRLTLSPGVELARAEAIAGNLPDENWTFHPVPLQSILNASQIDGKKIARESVAPDGKLEVAGVPFELPEPSAAGHDHVDLGPSWFRQGNLDGRYSGRGADAMTARWAGALIKDPTRLTVRLPMARYRALHFIAAADGDRDEVPVITAQFYRAQSGFPKNFTARVPSFSVKSDPASAEVIPVKTVDGQGRRWYRVIIPIEPGSLAEFDDLDYIDLELTKEVALYRASPDPMYYSHHAAGLPSSVHVFALTAERPALAVDFQADTYAHIWTAPENPGYTVTLRNRRGPAREVKLSLATRSLSGGNETKLEKAVKLPASGDVTVKFPLQLAAYGHHDVNLTITDGDQSWVEPRSLAYLREDTRKRGDWDFGRGPLFGFWNWGGGHNTPSAEKQLLAMARAGIETTPGSFEEYVKRHGDETRRIMEKYGIFTLKFAGAGDHYVTANFAGDLKKDGLEKAREKFVTTLRERASQPGPNSRPLFLSFYPEPSIGPVTHGIFPEFIGEPAWVPSDAEKDRYNLFLNGFKEGAAIVRKEFPTVKNLMPHGDPAFIIHFLRQNPEIAPLLDGVTVDIPCFERLPEQQFHQVAVHRLYMTRQEMAKAGIKKPLLPMYEGPCVPSGPGALTNQEQADITIRNSLILMAYGVDIQNGGFPAFDTASYWGEQHYGFGVLNRLSLETPKTAYSALATLTRHLNRANYAKWVPTGSHSVYAMQFKHYATGELVHVLWTLRGKRPINVEVPAGAKAAVFDQMDNEISGGVKEGHLAFTLDQSPCYLRGLPGDAKITLGEPDHSDARPAAISQKLASLGDGDWTLAMAKEEGYELAHQPYIYRYPSPMTTQAAEAPAAAGGRALSVHFPNPEKDRVFVPYYSVLTPKKPVAIAGKASHVGMWVKGASDWGRAIYFLRDAKGEQWINIGTAGAWNCDDLHSWMSFNFDGWRYLRMEMPGNSGHDEYREAGSAWWGPYSAGDGSIDYPLTLEKIAIERRTHVMYVDDPQPANRADVLLGDVYAEYASEADTTPEAVRLAAIRMPMPEVGELPNPLTELRTNGVQPAVAIERITLPEHGADGTRCYVHFSLVEGAQSYDVWVAPYEDGRGALKLGKAWKAPGLQVTGLRANQDFFLFVTYTDAAGKTSKPSAPFKINLKDFFGMK
jgi:hypothetical protein